MVMEIVSEGLDMRDAFLAPLWGEVAWEKDFVMSVVLFRGYGCG